MKRRPVSRFPWFGVIIAAVLIAALILFLERIDRVDDRQTVRIDRKPEPPARPIERERPAPKPPASEPKERQIAVLIDDIGQDLRPVEELALIGAPIAFAVLPHTPHAAEAARRLHAAGKEILLHLPMEPRSYPANNPGKGALFTAMTDREIREQVAEDLAAVPHVVGVNNHMGSRFMEDEARLTIVMEELAKRGLFFVDSRTSPASRGREAAAKAGVRFASRAVFIDHARGYAAALSNLTHPPRGDRRGRPLLMIGHPHRETVQALKEVLSGRHGEGPRVIPLAAYLETRGGKQFATERNP
jgi:polysaccharide deacetylase 2 family uncharacterized protein YibQ